MSSRKGSCADCAAEVVISSAVPVVRGGRVVLLCAACRSARPARRARAEEAAREEEIEYVIEYDLPPASADGEKPPSEATRSADGNVVSGSDRASASGFVETRRSRRASRPPPPAVIVSPDKED